MTRPTTFDPYDYKVEIIRERDEDGDLCFKATVAELEDFSLYESTAALAFECTVAALQDLYDSAVEYKHPFPSPRPKTDNDWTGRVTLRLPKTLHRRLVQQSNIEDVSLNTWLVSRLSEAVGVYEIVSTMSVGATAKVETTPKVVAHALLKAINVFETVDAAMGAGATAFFNCDMSRLTEPAMQSSITQAIVDIGGSGTGYMPTASSKWFLPKHIIMNTPTPKTIHKRIRQHA